MIWSYAKRHRGGHIRVSCLAGVLFVLGVLYLPAGASAATNYEQVKTTHCRPGPAIGEEFIRATAVNYTGAGGVDPGTLYEAIGGPGFGRVLRMCSSEGVFLSQTPIPGVANPRSIAIDPVNGRVFALLDQSSGSSVAVRMFEANGTEVTDEFVQYDTDLTSPLSTSPAKLHEAAAIAVTASCRVFIGDTGYLGAHEPGGQKTRVMSFAPAGSGCSNLTYTGQPNDLTGMPRANGLSFVNVDAAENVYVGGESGVSRFAPSTPAAPNCNGSIVGGGALGMTVDPRSGDVLYDSYKNEMGHRLSCVGTTFVEVGNPFAITPPPDARHQVGALSFDPQQKVEERSVGILYAGNQEGLTYVFALAGQHVPVIEAENTHAVSATGASLEATINPKGASTSYVFEYVTGDQFAANVAHGTEQEVQVAGTTGTGTFRLGFEGAQTGPLPFSATPDEVQTALEALASIGEGNVTVTGGPGDSEGTRPYVVSFAEALGTEVSLLTAEPNGSPIPVVDITAGGFGKGATRVPPGGGPVGGGQAGVPVSATVVGLSPATQYRFRAVALGEQVTFGQTVTFSTYPAAISALLDGRAYEMVSPAAKGTGEVYTLNPMVYSCATECKPGAFQELFPVLSAPDGNAFVFEGYPFSSDGPNRGVEYLSRRGSDGWSTTTLGPPQKSYGEGQSFAGYSETLDSGILYQQQPSLSPAGPGEYGDLYQFDTGSPLTVHPLLSASQFFSRPAMGNGKLVLRYAGASSDQSHVFFEANDALTLGSSDAPPAVDGGPGAFNLYEWTAGGLRLVNVYPGNGTTEPGAEFGAGRKLTPGNQSWSNALQTVSSDGTRVFWTGADGQLYRRNDGAVTDRVSVSQRSVEDPVGPQPALFYAASPQGNRVLFSSAEELTDDARTGSIAQTLAVHATAGTYTLSFLGSTTAPLSFNAALPTIQAALAGLPSIGSGNVTVREASNGAEMIFTGALAETEELITLNDGGLTGAASLTAFRTGKDLYEWDEGAVRDLTPMGGPGSFLGLAGQSRDLSHVFFFDGKVLTGANAEGNQPIEGGNNLYSSNGGSLSFVVTLGNSGGKSNFPIPALRTAEASESGEWLAFMSTAALTGYDNVGPCAVISGTGKFLPGPCNEVYLYDAGAQKLVCASCNPSGSSPLGSSYLPTYGIFATETGVPQPRYLSNSGRLFFDSADSLSPFDSNGGGEPGHAVEDVYEWEPLGVGSCGSSFASGGCLSLISSGRSGTDSNFLGADSSGRNIFFTTRDRLVAVDTDGLMDVYDAREGGGFAEEAAPQECQGQACQVTAGPPSEPGTASETASPEGPTKKSRKCKKGLVRHHGKCVKKATSPKHKKKAHSKKAHSKKRPKHDAKGKA